MVSRSRIVKPHAVCIPYPSQGHINPMTKLAKLLHSKGFHITFVNTEYNHKRLLRSRGPNSLDALPSFQFRAIPDGLPETGGDADVTQDIPALCHSITKNFLSPFKALISQLNNKDDGDESNNVPPVSCIISDALMSFAIDAAHELGIPDVAFWTASACGFLAYTHYSQFIQKGLTPFKDESYFTNGYLDTVIDWIPGMPGIRLRDIPSFIRTTDPQDIMLNFFVSEIERDQKATAIIINTYDALEKQTLSALSSIMAPPIYTIGPLNLLQDQVTDPDLNLIGSNLWKEEPGCLDWLDTKEPNSVFYVNFGSITVMTSDQMTEFAWGLANSNQTFLWVIRPDLVAGERARLPPEFIEVTKDRGLLANWCAQDKVLRHPSIGGFLTHSGWNSTIESISEGVPMICWPFFAEQQTNCRFCCVEWGIGMEINNDVRRDEVEEQVRELMEREKGKEMRRKAMELRNMAEEATSCRDGSSILNLEKLIADVLPCPGNNEI